MIISYYVCKTDYSHRKYFSIIFLFCNAFLAEQTQRFPWDISMKNKYSHETQIYSWNIYMKHKYFHENTNISMRHFHETKNLSVKYNIICFEAKIPNRENPRLYFIMWIQSHTLVKRVLIHSSVNIHLPAATIQISVIPRLAVHINWQYHPDHCWQGWFCFRALPMIKTKSFFYKCHENTYFVIRQVSEASSTSTKPIQKQSFSSGSVIPTGSWRESYFTTGKPNSLVIPQQTGSNPLVILRCCSVGYSTMHSFSKLHRGWEWKSSLTHYPTTTTNKYPLVRFRCINVKMTREFGWVGITRWQESYSTSPIPPSYLVVWFVLFVITNATVASYVVQFSWK